MAERVLLTGAGGFVGTTVGRRLAEAGYAVRAASRDPAALPATYGDRVTMPKPHSDPESWAPLLEGVAHVVHAGGLGHVMTPLPAEAYFQANADLTGDLAVAAARYTSGRFVFISSIRAVCGPVCDTVVSEATPPRPEDDYGLSKLEGERRALAAFGDDGRCTVLRPTLVYGPGVKGNLRTLQKLAALPAPLPLGGLDAKRSLLDVASLADAVLAALSSEGVNGIYILCDRDPVSVSEIVAAMRRGHDRRPGLFSIPRRVVGPAMRLAGLEDRWRRLTGPLVASSARLAADGWSPATDTAARIAAYARLEREDHAR